MSILLIDIRNEVGVVDTLKMASVQGKELEVPRMGLKSGLYEFEIQDVWVSFCCVTKYPKTEWLKTTTIY